jgi:crotonobetainyl-CoA:carnitine CoA-transferase CaiB-like acyl-CoA transferase
MQGVRVVDLCNVIAGPTTSAMLARFGAEVIKIDSTTPTYDPVVTTILGMPCQRGKKSVLLDFVKDPAARQAFEKLIQWANVVTVNCTEPQLVKLNLTLEYLKTLNPNIILLRFDAYGGPGDGGGLRGSRSRCIGYDDNLQAASGIQIRFGGSQTTPEEHAHIGTIDVVAGFCSAFSTALALLDQKRQERPILARASLAAAANLLQASVSWDRLDIPRSSWGRVPFNEPAGPGAQGEHPLYRCYNCANGESIFLAAGPRPLRVDEVFGELFKVPMLAEELGNLPHSPGHEQLQTALAAAFAQHSAEECCKQINFTLRHLSIGAVPITSLQAVREATTTTKLQLDGPSFQFLRQDSHPLGKPVTMFAPVSVRPLRAQALSPSPVHIRILSAVVVLCCANMCTLTHIHTHTHTHTRNRWRSTGTAHALS